ncbi:MAG: hypothetical protein UW22_C0009G0013 [Candidatus Gottesmanbacteria bacterium GW2011_GWB1_44_11c]|nr:MAG: hypothetical protein UW22_C0009G0013 [Candidatus Gottesmanbacteria bacterium GW2011_GWB1_44_11c]
MDNLGSMAQVSSLEHLEDESRYPGFAWTEGFDEELKAAATNTQKACICAREGCEEMVQFDYLPKAKSAEGLGQEAYGQIYLLALERHAQKIEELAQESTGFIQKSFFGEAERMREKIEVYQRIVRDKG